MDYIESEREFFSQFIVDDFDQYVQRKRINGVWGDDIELQAMSEIYDRPIELYAYKSDPMRTFHEEQNKASPQMKEPIRLSYHGSEHYNSVVKY